MSIKPIEFTQMQLTKDKESSQHVDSKPVVIADTKTQTNDANNTWVTGIFFSNGHKVSYESRDRWKSFNEAQALARDYLKSLTPEEVGEVIENEDEGWKLYTYRNLTNGMPETKLVDCYGNEYFGQGETKRESQVAAVQVYKGYQLNGVKTITVSRSERANREQLASDIRTQEKIMAGLIDKANRSGVDGRLVAMAATKFEFGFMALDKALTTHKE